MFQWRRAEQLSAGPFRLALLGLAATGAATCGGRGALAQSFEDYLPATVPGYDSTRGALIPQRPRNEYDPLGIHSGAFTIRPNIDEAIAYDTNVLGRKGGPQSWVVSTAPTIAFDGAFGDNKVGGAVMLHDSRFLDQHRQSRTDASGAIGGTYHIRNDAITFGISQSYAHQDPTSIDSGTLTEPLGFNATDVRLRYQTDIGRWRFEPNAQYIAYRFDNQTLAGDPLSQKVRDRDLFVGGLTVRFSPYPERSAVLVVRGIESRYVAALNGAPRPNSTGYEVLAGIDYAVSGNLQILALAGYEVRQFENSAYRTRSSPVAQLAAVFTPSGLTTVTARVTRSVEDSIGETTTGVTYTRGDLTLDQEVRRNWLAQLTTRIDHADYAQGGGSETVYSAGASLSYRFNRNLRAGASYSFSSRSGAGVMQSSILPSGTFSNMGNDYIRHVALLSVGLAL